MYTCCRYIKQIYTYYIMYMVRMDGSNSIDSRLEVNLLSPQFLKIFIEVTHNSIFILIEWVRNY